MVRVIVFLVAVAVAAPVAAQTVRTKVEKVSLTLPLPAGHCRLERGHRVDRRLIQAVERLAAKSNRLLASFADCAERDAFRAGTQKFLDNFGQYMMPRKDARTNMAPAEFARKMAEHFKTQGADVFLGAEADTRERIGALRLNVAIGETRTLGVLRTDERASYLGLVQSLKTDDGSAKLQVGVVAFGVVKGRIVTLNLYSRFSEGPVGAETTVKLLEKAAQSFAALTEANAR